MTQFQFTPLFDPDVTYGGGAVVAGAAAEPVTDLPWSEFAAKYPDPAKLEPYKAAKTWGEVYDMQGKRLAEAQTALRTRPAALPERPGADAPPEALSAWRAAHGIPETPEGYQLTKPDDVPDSQWRPGDAEAFSKWAHEEGLSPALVKKLQGFDTERQRAWTAEVQQAQAQEKEALQAAESAELAKRFGANVDPILKDLQEFSASRGKDADIFNPASEKFWGVEAVAYVHDLLSLVKRGEDGTTRRVGTPSAVGAWDKTWAKESMTNRSHPDYEARTNPAHPRHAEINAKAAAAYAAG